MQELSHRHNFRSIRNKMTKIIPELSFHDVLPLNSTNLLMLEGNARTKSCSMCKKKRNNLITHELLLMTSSHKPGEKTYFCVKVCLHVPRILGIRCLRFHQD